MKKGVIAAITVVICAVLAATYTFAAPTKGKEKKGEETTVESTTTEKKEATTQEKKTATETTEAEKEAKEKNEIENLKNKVSVLLLQLKVPDNVIKDCKKILDYKGTSLKGYYFVKSNGEITGIKGIHVDNGINQIICDDDAKNLYRITSSHIHSSFLSVLQFGQMFNDNINSYVKTIIKSTYILLATILYDFCCYSNDAHIILNQIDKDAFEILSYILKENKHDYINCIRK